MKLNPFTTRNTIFEEETIASFGEARLVRKHNGDYQLRGGVAADRTAAKEWVSLFMHEAAISFCIATVGRPPEIQDMPN